MNHNQRVAYLLKLYLADKINGTELQELKDLLLQGRSETAFQDALDVLIEQSPVVENYEESAWEPLYQKILERGTIATEPASGHGRVVSLFRKSRWVAAAVLILLATGGGGWLFFKHSTGKDMARHISPRQKTAGDHDIAPGGDKAVLTLADGSTIDLNATNNGVVGRQGNSRIVKLSGGRLAYQTATGEKSPATSGVVAYNTIATPRGGQYQLVLPDGSKVWLNAASSLRYPTAFSGKERVVELKGEAYFEIAHFSPESRHGKMPFRVHVVPVSGDQGVDVQVLGTHFNVMAYTDEQSINTTLLEGAVKLSKGEKEVLIRPGEQARSNNTNGFKVAPADVEEAVAWKNGVFRFNEATIEEVMRQISRWYDVEVVYVNDAPKDLFRGEIYRNVSVSKVLKVLEASGVHFTVDGKKILVQS
jgi:ferric-dicitrate binding protein FerR (iron transport regulator)